VTTAEIQKKRVPVCNEFPDVLEEISGLSPDRAVEFSIDTIPSTVPVAKAHTERHPLS